MIHFYRIARWLYLRRVPVLPRAIYIFNRIVFAVVLPPSAEVGRNVVFGYSGLGIVVHKRARIGSNVTISPNVTIGGRAEFLAVPVIEDDVMIGGNCGIYEGVRVQAKAVLASGVILTASTKLYDTVNNRIITSTKDEPLTVPAGAVIVPGSRRIESEFAKDNGLSIYTPIIIKYRDDKTDSRTALEEALR